MKKLMMMAMMVVASATAFAGDSDAFKAFKKSFKGLGYAEAEALVKSSIDQFANAQEKAAAYNMLVDLAYDAFNKQSTIETENQLAKQMGQQEKPIDKELMAESAYNAICNAITCDQFDQQPNEKGKVAPKFAEKNAQRLWMGPRNALVNAGQEAVQAKDNAKARKYWELFAESDEAPLFAACDRGPQKPFFGQVARFAAVFAYQDKDMDKALKLCDIAMKDPEEYEGCLNLKLEILGNDLKTKEDSVKFIGQLRDIYAEHKTDGVMEKLFNMLSATGDQAGADKILDDALAENFVALADKGLGMLNSNPAEAAKYLKKAAEVKSDNAAIQTYAGTALSVQAQNTEDPAQKKALYKEAIGYYDKAKELDPDRLAIAKINDDKADKLLLKRVGYYGIGIAAPYIMMRHWDEWQESKTFTIDETDLGLCDLVLEIQYRCQHFFFGEYARHYYDNMDSDPTREKRHYQKTSIAYGMLPETFTREDVMRHYECIKGTADVIMSRLVKDNIVKRIDKGIYQKMRSSI